MIIAHLADLHLGYRAYNRVDLAGINQREADVAAAFGEAIAAIIRLRPHVVLIAGDFFHSVRPSNAAIAEAFRGLALLAARLPGVPVVIIAGDRDTPRSSDSASILPLFREIPGVVVVTEAAERVHLDAIDATVLALPHAALVSGTGMPIEPARDSRSNILMVHATLTGTMADAISDQSPEPAGAQLPEDTFDPADWDYVALGHRPLATRLAPNMWYCGGIERTSPHIWTEAGVDKGFLDYDTEIRTATFHPLSTREVVDLPPLSARDRSAAEVDLAIAAALDAIPRGPAGKIVRLVIADLPRDRLRELDHRRIRAYRTEALHLLLATRPPEPEAPKHFDLSARGRSLEQQVEEYLMRRWAPTMEAIDRTRLVALARGYLERSGDGWER